MEIERKFLLDRLPDLVPESCGVVYQGYLSVHPEVRIRCYQAPDGSKTYTLTVKGEGTLSREEAETPITASFYQTASALIDKPMIRKDYFRYRYANRILECSVVDQSFCYGEVEFDTEAEALAFQWPLPGARDVTHDPHYKMKHYWEETRL